MTNKHTPGPWRLGEYLRGTVGYKNGKAFYICSDDGTPAFQVLKSERFDHRNGKTGHFWDPSAKAKDRANASLIAAAPELLAALEFCDNVLLAAGGPARAEREQAALRARAAIRKAKGE